MGAGGCPLTGDLGGLGIDDGYDEGYEKGISVGLQRGAYEKALETARNLLSEGLNPQMVARCTSLPLETVQELAPKQ